MKEKNEYGINKTRLRGVYDPSLLSKHHKINILENKLPMTLDLGKKMILMVNILSNFATSVQRNF